MKYKAIKLTHILKQFSLIEWSTVTNKLVVVHLHTQNLIHPNSIDLNRRSFYILKERKGEENSEILHSIMKTERTFVAIHNKTNQPVH